LTQILAATGSSLGRLGRGLIFVHITYWWLIFIGTFTMLKHLTTYGELKMGGDKLLEQAKVQGYIIGRVAEIDLLQNSLYVWCLRNKKPYLAVTIIGGQCNFSLDTPAREPMLSKNGVSKIEGLLQQYDRFTVSMEGSMDCINVPIKDAENLAKRIIGIFQDKNNLTI
jgi:hypothetical protein